MSTPPPSEITDPYGRRLWYNPYSGLYTPSRSYGLRMQRNYARGVRSQTQARRGTTPAASPYAGMSESQRRRAISVAQTGQTPSQRYQASVDARLRRYGGSWAWYQRIYRLWIHDINERVGPSSRIGIREIESELANAWLTGHTTQWVEDRLAIRLDAIIAYQDDSDTGPGRWLVFVINANDPAPPQWWYYH